MPLITPSSEARFWGSGDSPRARFLLFGAPLDLTGSGRLGTGQAPPAVRKASHNIESYSPILDADLFDAGLCDLGDLDLAGLRMEDALAEIERQTSAILGGASTPIVVGGEHTIALAIGRAVKKLYPDAVIISLDAHLDLADELEGRKVAHGTWVCRLGEELGGFQDFILLGMRSGTRDEWQRSKGCLWQSPRVVMTDELRGRIGNRPVYLSVDIDVLDPSAAPGTGTPEPPGITSAVLFDFVYSLKGLNMVALDVNEILPEVDPAGITAITGAKLIREATLALSGS
jgi:agmatinase